MKDIILITETSSDIGVNLINRIYNEEIIIVAHYKTNHALLPKKYNIIPIQCNLANQDKIYIFIENIKKYGYLNKFIHLALYKLIINKFKDKKWNSFYEHLNIPVGSIATILQDLLPTIFLQMDNLDKKVIFMLSSCTINMPPYAMTDYVTAKHALLGLMKVLASEYRQKNIRINAISPSMIDTKFLSDINQKIIELNTYNRPLKRNAKVGDIISLIEFLLSADSNFINSVNIPISGGETF